MRRFDALALVCGRTIVRASFLFGKDSPAGKAASEADESISALMGHVLASPIPWDEDAITRIDSAFNAAASTHDAFLLEAHAAIQPKSWQG
jgi:hypothetical protein